ncbi:MAG: hypothetical protein P1U56_17960 [Saprospiraceae bacterium]|nr:hypothetical protein [Saprospiraceae bacterium]
MGKSTDSLIIDDKDTRIKSIVVSDYNRAENTFSPRTKRIINYSRNFTHLEYLEYDSNDEIFEKVIAEYKDDKLIHKIFSIGDHESHDSYTYDQFGDLIGQTSRESDYQLQDTFIYLNRKLINHKAYKSTKALDKTLIYEEDFTYDKNGNKLKKDTSTPEGTKTTNYAFDAQHRIISKSEPYKRYKITYEGDTLISILKSEGAEFEKEDTKTKIFYNQKGQLVKVVLELSYEKYTTDYSYDKNNNLIQLTSIIAYPNGRKGYSKVEFGPYSIKSNFIYPSWFVSCDMINRRLVKDITNLIDEDHTTELINETTVSRLFKTFPDYYIRYQSKDGIDWVPESKMDFNFITSGE